MLPILAWLVLQLAALAAPLHANTPVEARLLFAALDVDRIVICTPDGRKVLTREGETRDDAVCLTCKAALLLSSLPACQFADHQTAFDIARKTYPGTPPVAASLAHIAFRSRAPPPIQTT